MANWGKLSSSNGNLYFSESSLNLLENNYNYTKSKELEKDYTEKDFNWSEAQLVKNEYIKGYDYLFFTLSSITYETKKNPNLQSGTTTKI